MSENNRHYIRFHASRVLKTALQNTNRRSASTPKPTKFQIKRGKQILAHYQNKPGELAQALKIPTTKAKSDKIVNSFLRTLSKTLITPNFKVNPSTISQIEQYR